MNSTDVALACLAGFALLSGGAAAHAVRRSNRAPPVDRRRMSKSELQTLAEMVGFPDSDIAAAIALAESAGDPKAIGDNGLSIGLWQIYTKAHPTYARADLFDPLKNAHAAYEISEKGRNWRPWTTFRNGAYKQFLRGV